MIADSSDSMFEFDGIHFKKNPNTLAVNVSPNQMQNIILHGKS